VNVSLADARRRSEKGFDRFRDHIVDAVKLVGRNDIRRKDIDDVAERAKQHAALQEKIVELRAEAGEVAGVVNAELQRAESAELPRIADLMEVAE